MISNPIAIGIPINIKYITDINHAKSLIINYQQSIKE
jgi:hypothetical protein